MVLTQLQLKWPNHSTQLLTGLKYLFKNEQLVDCTLKCNKHTLKVHRSVLAACSPYFERELENSPLIVIKDMQFNVLQALIEFMYYGETRITEENLTSLIEAAKQFEIKGLSEMDLLTSNENNVIPSVAVNTNCNVVQSSFVPDITDENVFKNGTQTMDSTLESHIDEAISANNMSNKCLPDVEDANSNLMMENTTSQSHSSRNFVITPPQTESAHILLSLAACSYSQKQYLSAAAPNHDTAAAKLQNGGADIVAHANLDDHNMLFDETSLMIHDTITSSSNSPNSLIVEPRTLSSSGLRQHENGVADALTDGGEALYAKHNGDDFVRSVDSGKSFLAKLLTRNNQNSDKGGVRYENLYDAVDSDAKNQNNQIVVGKAMPTASTSMNGAAAVAAATHSTAVDLQTTGLILGCPFLIETTEGFVDVSMENVFSALENGDLFESHDKNTMKIIPKEEVVSLTGDGVTAIAHTACGNVVVAATTAAASPISGGSPAPVLPQQLATNERPFHDPVLERIKADTEDELKDDPEAVVLTRVTDDGRLEKYVLSSADVKALQQMNERRKQRQAEGCAASTAAPLVGHIDVESPMNSGSGDASSLITRIVQFAVPVDNAISKLPFKKSSSNRFATLQTNDTTTATADGNCCNDSSNGVNNINSSSSSSSSNSNNNDEALLLNGSTLHQQPSQQQHQQHSHHHHHHPHHHHHHENMFEELDSQFTMDCSIENIQREYVAYEEASKNETQLEHNYYANAMKDEDEECVVISGENYDLPAMMLVEQPLVNGNALGGVGKTKNSYQHMIGASDVYLNNVVVETSSVDEKEKLPARRNGLVVNVATAVHSAAAAASNKTTLFNGKRDLIINNDALMSSAGAPTIATSNLRLTNGTPPSRSSSASAATGTAAAAAFKTSKNGEPSKRAVGRTATVTNGESGPNLLPFKSVKNTSEKKPRRTYKRKANSVSSFSSSAPGNEKKFNQNVVSTLNGALYADNSLVEEIIVDEIS